MSPTTTFIISLLAGMLPAIIWLWFWLKEDRVHPEPRRLVLLSFILGMATVPLVIPLQIFTNNALAVGIILLAVWAGIEELAKFIAAYVAGIHTEADDEPIDAVIYMVAAALGFSALENIFFLISPETCCGILGSIAVSNLRFVGATVLHTVSSGAIGVAMALSFYGTRAKKIWYLIAGILVAILLHTLFNLFILQTVSGAGFISVLLFIWVMVVIMILFLEKVKRITRMHNKINRDV